MVSRRALALALCAAAGVVLAAAFASQFACGARRTTEPCATPEECLAASECVRAVHPLLAPWAGAVLVAAVGAWGARPSVPLGAGLASLGLGLLAIFSAGVVGLATGAVLLGAGWIAPARPGEEPHARLDRVAAAVGVLALVASFAAMVAGLGRFSVFGNWILVLAPTLAFAAFAARPVAPRPA